MHHEMIFNKNANLPGVLLKRVETRQRVDQSEACRVLVMHLTKTRWTLLSLILLKRVELISLIQLKCVDNIVITMYNFLLQLKLINLRENNDFVVLHLCLHQHFKAALLGLHFIEVVLVVVRALVHRKSNRCPSCPK